MPRSYSIPLITGIVLLLMFLMLFWTGMDSAFSKTSAALPVKQFHLPPNQGTGLTASQMHGKAMYLYYCATCHGATGNSDGFNSYSLKPSPPKLSDPKIMAPLSDKTLKHAIKDGGTALGLSPHMPPWGRVLTNRDIDDTIQYIHTLMKK